MLGLQVLPARGRRRPRAVLDVCPVRDRALEGLYVDVPGDARAGPDGRICSTTTASITGWSSRSPTGSAQRSRRSTADARHLPAGVVSQGFTFTPGQYVDCRAERGPAALVLDRQHARRRSIELIVKRYQGGRLSGLLGGRLDRVEELAFTGPYGAFHVRAAPADPDVAGGSGMAPVLSLLRSLAAASLPAPGPLLLRCPHPGGPVRPDEIESSVTALGLPFRPGRRWLRPRSGRPYLSGELGEPEVYMCGPPPMIDAAEEILGTARHRAGSGSSATSSRQVLSAARWRGGAMPAKSGQGIVSPGPAAPRGR